MSAATGAREEARGAVAANEARAGWKSGAVRILLGAAAATWRIRESIPRECRPALEGEANAVIAFWHFQMIPLWFTLRRLRPAAIVSPSRDGGLLAAWLGGLGYRPVLRGSSSRGGGAALAAAVEQLAVRSLVLTPDGPRGPARRAKPGALVAALRAEAPLVVAGWTCNRVIRFRSWDRMEVPMPFARVEVRYSLFDTDGLATDRRLVDDDLARLSAAIDAVASHAGRSGSDRR